MTQYNNMKKEVIEVHMILLNNRIWYFNKYKLNEGIKIYNYIYGNSRSPKSSKEMLLKMEKEAQKDSTDSNGSKK